MIPELRELRLFTAERQSSTVWHSHPLRQMECVVAGGLEISLGEETVALEPGDFCLLGEEHLHRVDEPAGCTVHHGFVDLTQSPKWFSSAVAPGAGFDWLEQATIVVRQASDIDGMLREIEDWWERGHADARLVAQCLLVRLVATLKPRDMTVIPAYSRSPQAGDRSLFERAVRVIEEVHREPLTKVSTIARACSVSRSTLDKLFCRRVGHGPKEFLRRYRVDRARELLRRGDLSVSEVAAQTGFMDPFAFSRVFKRVTGVSPSRYGRTLIPKTPCSH